MPGWQYAQYVDCRTSGTPQCGCSLEFPAWTVAEPAFGACIPDAVGALVSKSQLAEYVGDLGRKEVGRRWAGLCVECTDGIFATLHWYASASCAPEPHLRREVLQASDAGRCVRDAERGVHYEARCTPTPADTRCPLPPGADSVYPVGSRGLVVARHLQKSAAVRPPSRRVSPAPARPPRTALGVTPAPAGGRRLRGGGAGAGAQAGAGAGA